MDLGVLVDGVEGSVRTLADKPELDPAKRDTAKRDIRAQKSAYFAANPGAASGAATGAAMRPPVERASAPAATPVRWPR